MTTRADGLAHARRRTAIVALLVLVLGLAVALVLVTTSRPAIAAGTFDTVDFAYRVNAATVTFQGSATTTNGSAVNYSWSFGDQNYAWGQNATHVFATRGATYRVILTVEFNRTDGTRVYVSTPKDVAIAAPGLCGAIVAAPLLAVLGLVAAASRARARRRH